LHEDDPLHAPRQARRSLDQARCDHREGKRGEGEVESGKAKRGNAEKKADDPREQARDGDRDDEVHVEVVSQDGRGIGAQSHEGAVA